jgi:hypothetical protein
MPSPRRLARRSVALLARQGLPRGQAAEVIMHVCDDAAHRLYASNLDADASWLAQLRAEASAIRQRELRSAGQSASICTYYGNHTFMQCNGYHLEPGEL